MIKVALVNDSLEELKLVETESCTFAIHHVDDQTLFISTKHDPLNLEKLTGWNLILNTGPKGIKRFEVKSTKETAIAQLRCLFGENNVSLFT